MADPETQLNAAARSATAVNNIARDIIDNAICDFQVGCNFHLTDLILARLRANGYVIKRAVPPCRGYERYDDASGE